MTLPKIKVDFDEIVNLCTVKIYDHRFIGGIILVEHQNGILNWCSGRCRRSCRGRCRRSWFLTMIAVTRAPTDAVGLENDETSKSDHVYPKLGQPHKGSLAAGS